MGERTSRRPSLLPPCPACCPACNSASLLACNSEQCPFVCCLNIAAKSGSGRAGGSGMRGRCELCAIGAPQPPCRKSDALHPGSGPRAPEAAVGAAPLLPPFGGCGIKYIQTIRGG